MEQNFPVRTKVPFYFCVHPALVFTGAPCILLLRLCYHGYHHRLVMRSGDTLIHVIGTALNIIPRVSLWYYSRTFNLVPRVPRSKLIPLVSLWYYSRTFNLVPRVPRSKLSAFKKCQVSALSYRLLLVTGTACN